MTIATPSLPADLVERWGIRSSALIADTRTSLVHRVLRRDGSRAITKQLKPEGLHELSGIDFLDWRKGCGSVLVLDRRNTACLLEDAGTLMLKDYRLQHGEDAANNIILSVLGELHSASVDAPPDSLIPLRSHFQPLFERTSGEDKPDLSAALAYSASIADDLLSSQSDIRPLHGDLHHENIVSGSERGWLAIDPQGLLGDPAYDVANVFGNPDGAFADIIDPQRITRLVDLFAPAIGCEREKILRYAIAHAGLSICWSLEGGDRISGDGNAMERLAFLNVANRLLDERAFSL
jgi:streptomycin 6-kinase